MKITTAELVGRKAKEVRELKERRNMLITVKKRDLTIGLYYYSDGHFITQLTEVQHEPVVQQAIDHLNEKIAKLEAEIDAL